MDKLTNLPKSNILAGQSQRPHLPSATHGRVSAPNNINLSSSDVVAFSSDNLVSMKAIFHAFNQNFAKFNGFDQSLKENELNEETTFNSDEVTETIFGFIKDSLMKAKANGKSGDELKEMFEQAKEGVAKGFGQALDELSELNKLTDDIRQGVAKSHEDLNRHIDELFHSFFPEKVIDSENKSKADEIDNDLRAVNSEQRSAENSRFRGDYSYSDARNSEVSITTNDGDEVRISFFSNEQTNASVGVQSNGASGHERFVLSAGYGREFGFSIEVDGELDEGEREAISSLLKDIDKLQESFFSGDLNGAFDHAMNLGFDTNELAKMSLELEQTQTFKAREVYQEVAEIGHEPVKGDKSLRPILDFIAEIRAMRQRSAEVARIEDGQFTEIFKQLSLIKFAEEQEKAEKLISLAEGAESKEMSS